MYKFKLFTNIKDSAVIQPLFILLLLSTPYSTITAADKLATVLRGKVLMKNTADAKVFITESDGSILDMARISKDGKFQLDLTIMDTPSQEEVNKLILEVRKNKGNKKKYFLKPYIESFNDTVLLREIVYN